MELKLHWSFRNMKNASVSWNKVGPDADAPHVPFYTPEAKINT